MTNRATLKIASSNSLNTSARHSITLRSSSGNYHSLLLFKFPAAPNTDSLEHDRLNVSSSGPSRIDLKEVSDRYYCMEAQCPHLGAPLETAAVEEQEDLEGDIEDLVVVCPWHEYDFSLKTGESSTGMNTCVYQVEEREGSIFIEPPSSNHHEGDWQIVEVRPVSEAFSNQREKSVQVLHQATSNLSLSSSESIPSSMPEELPSNPDQVQPPSPIPSTLVEWACLILNTGNPAKKVAFTRFAANSFRTGEVKLIGGGRFDTSTSTSEELSMKEKKWIRKESETPPSIPPRENLTIVKPGYEGKRGKAGSEKSRINMLHSLANIEQWAIDLAWDLIARTPELSARLGIKVPLQLYSDFIKIAVDEAKHFTLLSDRLKSMGSYFGALPVHKGLWDSATDTNASLLSRLSIIHLVHEARGLDVNPNTIQKFRSAGDQPSTELLTTIHLDEITHVSSGHRWLLYLCSASNPPLDPVETFRKEVKTHFVGKLKGPFNEEDRAKAGLKIEFYDNLEGEKPRQLHPPPVAGG